MNSIIATARRGGFGHALTIPIRPNVSALSGLMKELKAFSAVFDGLTAHTLIVTRPFYEVLHLEGGEKLCQMQKVIYDLSSSRSPMVILSGPTLNLRIDASMEVVALFAPNDHTCNWCGCVDGPCGQCRPSSTNSTVPSDQ